MVVDAQHVLRLVNPSFIGLFEPKGDPLGQTVLQLLREPELEEMISAALATGEPQTRDVATNNDLAVPAIQTRVLSIFSWRGDSSNAYRITVWTSALRMFADNWLLGIGPGNDTFKQVYGMYMTPGFSALGAYSVPLEILVEQGIVGFSVFVTMVLALFLRMARALFALPVLSRACLLGFVFLAMLACLAYGVFDTIWYRPSVNQLFWFLVAVLAFETEPVSQEARHV